MGTTYGAARRSSGMARILVLVVTDILAMYAAFVAAYIVRSVEGHPFLHYETLRSFCKLAAVLAPSWIVIFMAGGLYSPRAAYGRVSEAGRVVLAVSVGVMLLIVADYLNTDTPLFPGKAVPLYALAFGVLFVLLSRALVRLGMRIAFARGRSLHNIIMIGTGPLAERLANDLVRRGHGNRIVAAVSLRDDGRIFAGNLPVYATLERALEAHHVRIDELVQADVDMDRGEVARLMSVANANGMGYRFVPDQYGVYAAASTMSTIAGVPVMEVRLTSLDGWGAFLKRAFDFVGALVGLLLLAPLFLVLAAMVKLSDRKGPVFYKQARLGRGGRPIGVFKFRSMKWEFSTGPNRPYKTAVEAFEAMGRSDLCAEFVLQQKVADDPRVSGLGVFLRRTSLDELPQLLNALFGHLSLVGPRPITVAELERYGDQRASFLALKPGITGLWQVSGRSDTGYDERVKLDVFYVENWSLQLDLSILVRTVATVAARRGAY